MPLNLNVCAEAVERFGIIIAKRCRAEGFSIVGALAARGLLAVGRMQRGLRKVSKSLYRWLKTGANLRVCANHF